MSLGIYTCTSRKYSVPLDPRTTGDRERDERAGSHGHALAWVATKALRTSPSPSGPPNSQAILHTRERAAGAREKDTQPAPHVRVRNQQGIFAQQPSDSGTD
jgi:hypothetical protein